MQRRGAVLDGAHVGLCPTKLRVAGAGHRQPWGCDTFFFKCRFGDLQPLGQFLPRRLLILQRTLEALNRAELRV